MPVLFRMTLGISCRLILPIVYTGPVWIMVCIVSACTCQLSAAASRYPFLCSLPTRSCIKSRARYSLLNVLFCTSLNNCGSLLSIYNTLRRLSCACTRTIVSPSMIHNSRYLITIIQSKNNQVPILPGTVLRACRLVCKRVHYPFV
ncbi:hypothetical protein D3C80_1354010 [compost metagenome]